MNDLWISASMDAEGERRGALVSSAQVACADNFAFVASASSSTEYEDRLALVSRDVESKIARLTVDSPEMFPLVHSAVLDSWESDFRSLMSESAMKKGAPFAGYSDFDDCVRKNSGKDNPEAYCGSIKSKVEKSAATRRIRVGESFGPEARYNVEEIDGDMALVYDNMNRTTFWRRVDSITPDFGPSRFNSSRRKWASMPRFAENGPDQFGPDPSSQNGEAFSQLDDVDVDSAPENSNMGWIDEDNAYERRKDASRRRASRRRPSRPNPSRRKTAEMDLSGQEDDWGYPYECQDSELSPCSGPIWHSGTGGVRCQKHHRQWARKVDNNRHLYDADSFFGSSDMDVYSSRRRIAAVDVIVRTFTTDEGSEVEVYYNGIRYCTGCGTKFIDYTDDEVATHSCDGDATGSWERIDWNEGDVPAWQRRASRRTAMPRVPNENGPMYNDGFIGDKYRSGRDVKDIARNIRSDIKGLIQRGEIPGAPVKYSVTIDRYSGGQAIRIGIKNWDEYAHFYEVDLSEPYNTPGYRKISIEADSVKQILEATLNSYRRNMSDPMVDYYDVNFYGEASFDYSTANSEVVVIDADGRRIASRRRRVTSSENPFAKKNETNSETEDDTDSDEGMEEAPQEMEQTGPQMNGVDPSELSVGESVQVSYTMAEGGQGTVDCTFVREENGVFFFNGPTGEFGIADTGSGFQDADGNTFILQSESADEKSAKTSSRRKTAMPSPAEMGVRVGDIFYNSWGYDQTNVDFYEVIRLTGAGVEVVPVYSRVVEGDAYNEYVVPSPGEIRSRDVIIGVDRSSKVCRLKPGYQGKPTITLSDRHSASLWDGRPLRQSGPYGGH